MGENCDKNKKKGVDGVTNVYIWDMDETLILLKSLLNGAYAQSFNGLKDAGKGVQLGKMWEDHILKICDECFFYEQIENYDKPFLDALKQYDDDRDLTDYDFDRDGFSPPFDDPSLKKLAYRHRAIAYRYKQGLQNILDKELLNSWDELYNMTDEYTDRWLSSARALLEQCSSGKEDSTPYLGSGNQITESADTKSQHVNVLVTSGSLIPSLVKCLLFRLDNLIVHGNGMLLKAPKWCLDGFSKCRLRHLDDALVFSSLEVGKLQCFQWIKERFNNPNVRFCVIGDGWEECEAAQNMRWPFVKIDLEPGSCHRFPGLSLRTLGCYFSVVYGSPEDETDEE